VEMVPLNQVQQLTGYIRGGVTALGGKRDYPCLLTKRSICSTPSQSPQAFAVPKCC
jgi:hypothetical protein